MKCVALPALTLRGKLLVVEHDRRVDVKVLAVERDEEEAHGRNVKHLLWRRDDRARHWDERAPLQG